jgi:hypothetical protein
MCFQTLLVGARCSLICHSARPSVRPSVRPRVDCAQTDSDGASTIQDALSATDVEGDKVEITYQRNGR